MAQDALGNAVGSDNIATLRGIDDFVTGFLAYETKATNVLAAADADPDSVLANIYAGFTWMFLEAATAEEHAQLYLDRARSAAAAANPREALLLRQLERWIAGDIPAVQSIGESIVDLAALAAIAPFDGLAGEALAVCTGEALNPLMALGQAHWSALRLALSRALRAGSPLQGKIEPLLAAQADA